MVEAVAGARGDLPLRRESPHELRTWVESISEG